MTRFRLWRYTTLGTVLAALTAISAQVPPGPPPADPRRDPVLAVKEMIRLIEKKDYVTLVKTFATPEELADETRSRPIAEVADEFGLKQSALYLEMLKAASQLKPSFDRDGTRATFQFEKPIAGERRVRLVKVGEFWYLD